MAPRSSLNMGILDHSGEEEEQKRYAATSSRSGSRFGARRPGSHQHLLLMDCVGGSDNGDGASEETVPPLPDYERLTQCARLPDDPDHDTKNPPPPSAPGQQRSPAKQGASPPQPPPPTQQQKPAVWRLIEYVRSRRRSDGDSKSSDGEDGGEEGKKEEEKKKKRSSWLPDPERRWPVQGFY